MTPHQMPLPLLTPRAASGRADYLVAPCNQRAVALIDQWPNWPGGAALITGPAGAGKTHLGEVWRASSHARLATADTLTLDKLSDLLAGGRLLLDRADEIRDEQVLFHLLNLANAGEASVLLLSRVPPEGWPLRRPDLASRLKALPRANVDPPDETLLSALLAKLLSDRQISPVAPEIVSYLIGRIERSYAAAERAVEALDRASLGRKRGLTLRVARVALDEAAGPEGALRPDEDDLNETDA